MAQRRMFSLKIVSSDAFLDMPATTRELYFQLGMYADDDGFVNPKKIIRMLGASEDDLKVLLTKRFLLPFENGVVVIKHWLINNLVRKDFYQETVYVDQKKSIIIKENKAYTECLQNVNKLRTQDRIGKVRIGNNYGEKSPRVEITYKSMPISLEELSDGDVTYEDEFAKAPKKYKGLTKAYARIAIKYLQMRGEGGNVLRYYPDIKELWEFASKSVKPEKIEEEIMGRIELFKSQQEAKNLDWSLNGVVKNWNKVLKDHKS